MVGFCQLVELQQWRVCDQLGYPFYLLKRGNKISKSGDIVFKNNLSNPKKKKLYWFLLCTYFLWNKNSDSILLLPTQFSKIRIITGTFSCAEFHDLKPRLSFKWCSLNVYSPSPDSCVHQRNLYSVLVLLRDKIQGDFFYRLSFLLVPP